MVREDGVRSAGRSGFFVSKGEEDLGLVHADQFAGTPYNSEKISGFRVNCWLVALAGGYLINALGGRHFILLMN
jgi:hypothetical protein